MKNIWRKIVRLFWNNNQKKDLIDKDCCFVEGSTLVFSEDLDSE